MDMPPIISLTYQIKSKQMKKSILSTLIAAISLTSYANNADGAANIANAAQKVEANDTKGNITPEASKAAVAKILAEAGLVPEDLAAGDDVEGYAVVYNKQVAVFFKEGTKVNVGQKVTDLLNRLKTKSEDGKLYEDSSEFTLNENPKEAEIKTVDEINENSFGATFYVCYRKNGKRFLFTIQAGIQNDYKVGDESQYLETLSLSFDVLED